MPDMLIRGLTPEVITRLKAHAIENGRSVHAEVKAIVERGATQMTRQELRKARERAWKGAQRIRESIKARQHSDSAKLIREDRLR